MTRCRFRLLVPLLAVVLAAGGGLAYAQGGATSTLSGTVLDASGAVVPGATITAKDNATGAVFTSVSGANGAFTIPAMPPGTYTVNVELLGFKTAILNDVMLNVAVTSTVKAVLELGEIAETVIVQAATEIVQTQATSVAATMTARQIANLPVAGRGAFDLIRFMPGVVTNTGDLRDGTINGLPQSTVNITLDGMNIQDNYAKSWDGMFTRVTPRIDAVEEVTVSTAASSADMGGQGAAQVRYITRSGTNRYQGSTYFYYRRTWMNTNTWWNLNRNVDPVTGAPTPTARTFYDYPGARFGGPIIKDKMFFFVNYEEVRSPGTRTDTRTIMSPMSEQGMFQYSGGTVDLMALAAKNGQVATIDPTVRQLLADVRSSTSKGVVTTALDPLVQSFAWQQPTKSNTKYPTVKLDYQVTSKHRVSFSVTQNLLMSNPDTTNSRQQIFPGFPHTGYQDSERYVWQVSARSVLTRSLVNEFRVGGTGGRTLFSPNTTAEMYNNDGFGDMNGYNIQWSAFKSITNPALGTGYSAREGLTKLIEDTMSWVRGKHSLTMGASFTRGDVWLQNKTLVPTIALGRVTGDPADGLFTTTNFPGASSTDLTNARNLYSVLTGRITSIASQARIAEDGKQYVLLGESMQLGRMWQMGFFLQDSWRLRSDLTLNAGLRHELALPFYARNNALSTATIADLFGRTGPGSNLVVGSTVSNTGNLFKPGVQDGQPTTYKMLEKGTNTFKTDKNNLAPSIGIAWTTGSDGDGFLRRLLGAKGDSVIRGGLNVAYQRGGMSDFTEVYGANPGIAIDVTRNQTNGNLGTLPVLLRSSSLSPPAYTTERVYPMAVPSASSNVVTFDPDIKTPWAMTGTIGIQRALTREMAVEVRYVHSDSHGGWTLGNTSGRLNYNERMVVENGFLAEFRKAQANLAANLAASGTASFAYTGAPGTSPLPIFLANLNGLGGANANDPSKYSGSGWRDSTLVQSMYAYNPNPQTAASTLEGNNTYRLNMLAAGLPFNFWKVNPDVGNAQVVTNGQNTRYDGVQLMLRRRFSQGLQFEANYTYGKAFQSDFYSFRKPYVEREQNGSNGIASMGNVRHTFAVNWVYELPFGQGRRFASEAGPVLNRIIGDWSFMGLARVASGQMLDFGNVRLFGMTADELRKSLEIRYTKDPNNQYRTLVWHLPQDIIDNTIKAYSVTATGYSAGAPTGRYLAPANSPGCLEEVSGYGDCGMNTLVITGPPIIRFDMTFSKRIAIVGRVGFEFQAQIFNVFNRVNFNPDNSVGDTLDSYQVTGSQDSARTAQLSFRINF